MNSVELKHDTYLVAAWRPVREYVRQPQPIGWGSVDACRLLPHHDSFQGSLWVVGNEFGPTMVVRARSFDGAWNVMLDETPAIDPEDVPEAYGFDSQAALDAAVNASEDGFVDLIEGYEYQPNGSGGTGIVDVGHYVWIREYTKQDSIEGLRVAIRREI